MSEAPKISLDDLEDIFGDEVPVEVVQILFNSPEDWTIGRVREEIRKFATKFATKPAAAPSELHIFADTMEIATGPHGGTTHYTRTDAITPAQAAKVLRCPDGFNALVDAFEAAEGDTAARMDEALKAVAHTIAQEGKQ